MELQIQLSIAVSKKMINTILMTEIFCFPGQATLTHQSIHLFGLWVKQFLTSIHFE